MELRVLDSLERPGYFQNAMGDWHADRRKNPDRRAEREVSGEVMAKRTTVRRRADREMLAYLSNLADKVSNIELLHSRNDGMAATGTA